MLTRISLLILFGLSINLNYAWGQTNAHDQLIKMTTAQASEKAGQLGLTEEQQRQFIDIYVKEAVAIEDIIVNGEPDVAITKQVRALQKQREERIEELLEPNQEDLYEYLVEEEATQQKSYFDSLQLYLDNVDFKASVDQYYDEEVMPYIIYYHQTYFRPALKQKHYWKINQARASIYAYESLQDPILGKLGSDEDIANAFTEMDDHIGSLKRIRKRYRDELDYISVSIGPAERQWSADYLRLVKEHFSDDVYLRVQDYMYKLDAYGVHYLVGEFSLILLDIWNPRSYLDSRDSIVKVLREDVIR